MDKITLLILRIVLCFLGAMALFFASGLTYVRRNRFVFVSKGKRLRTIWDEGWHYRLPWKYHLSASYPKGPFSVKTAMNEGKILTAHLIIRDPKKLYRMKRSFKRTLRQEIAKAKSNTEIRKRLETAFGKGGTELINLVVTKKTSR